ncbi:hypothetical protein LINPERHAP1_LOCUS25138, partial [Linum perenne]
MMIWRISEGAAAKTMTPADDDRGARLTERFATFWLSGFMGPNLLPKGLYYKL